MQYQQILETYLKYPDRTAFAPEQKGDGAVLLYAGSEGLEKARHLCFLLDEDIETVEADRQRIFSVIEAIESIRSDDFQSELQDMDDADDILSASYDDAPIIRLVNSTVIRAVKSKASDIHFEGMTGRFAVRFRIDGKLATIREFPKSLQESVIARIKVMSDLDVAETRKPQDGRINLKIGSRDVDIRVSTVPSVTGEKAVLRILEKSASMVKLEKTGMPEEMLPVFRKMIKRPNGIILVTGPTGSGKTTTLYSALSEIVSDDTNIMTIEDPVEYHNDKITQVQVNRAVDITFASAVRSFLRQDPDVILIGEIRDKETAQAAVQASLTGHLVLSTLHTNTAPTAVARLIDMEVEPFLLSSSLVSVIGQRLVRKLCPHCKKPVQTDAYVRDFFAAAGSLPETLYEPAGCDECMHTGYAGRVGIFEMVNIDDSIRKLINAKADASEIGHAAEKTGYKPFIHHGFKLVASGITSAGEVIAVIGAK